MGELDGVHPTLVAAVQRVFAAMSVLGHPMRPSEGVRTAARQRQLFAQGRSTPGPIVTRNDGDTKPSNHQVKIDGYGWAVDSVFLGTDPYLEHHPHGTALWAVYGNGCKAMGLRWGGDLEFVKKAGFADKPHVELPYIAPTGLNA